jgi:hypothetical protein
VSFEELENQFDREVEARRTIGRLDNHS